MLPIHTTISVPRPPAVTWCLIALTALLLLWQLSLDQNDTEWLIEHLAFSPKRLMGELHEPSEITLATVAPLLTSIFLHGGLLHLPVNMWTLWLFGPPVEDRFGHGRFLFFYLSGGIIACVTHAYAQPTSSVPVLGASGAIAAVLGAYSLMFPLSRVIVVVPLFLVPLFFSMPALLFTGLWLVTQILSGTLELLRPHVGGGIAWWAHVGGFVAGILLTPVMRRRTRRRRRQFSDENLVGFSWRPKR